MNEEEPKIAQMHKGYCSGCGSKPSKEICDFCGGDVRGGNFVTPYADDNEYYCFLFNTHMCLDCLKFYKKEKMIDKKVEWNRKNGF